MKGTKLKAAGLLLSLLAFGASSVAHPPLFLSKRVAWERSLIKELDLTFSQIQELRKLQRARKHAINKIISSTPSPLASSMRGKTFKREVYERLRLERAKRIARVEAKFLESLYNLLTPPQRAKLRHLLSRARAFR